MFFSLLWLLAIAFFLSSCFAKRKDFYSYKYPIVNSGDSMLLKINGFYAPVSSKDRILFLFENGIIKEGPWVRDFFSSTSHYIGIINEDYYTQKGKEYYGCFMIKDSSIIIQNFNIHSSHNFIYRRWIFESRGIVLSDTSFVLYTNFEHLNNNEFYQEPVMFRFFPYQNKPDSANAWFNKKRWFKNNMHESRR